MLDLDILGGGVANNDALTWGSNGLGTVAADMGQANGAVNPLVNCGTMNDINTREVTLNIAAILDYADCRAVEIVTQAQNAPANTKVREPTLTGSTVVLPHGAGSIIGTALSGYGQAKATARGFIHVSMLALYKTGHHWTHDTVNVLRRLGGACCMSQDVASSLHGARTCTHVIKRNIRHDFMTISSQNGHVEASTRIRCSGTGHGLAKIALIKAIITTSRAGGTREHEIYILEVFHLAGILTDLGALLVGLSSGTITDAAGTVLNKSTGSQNIMTFSNCLMADVGTTMVGGVPVSASSAGATACFNEMRRCQDVIDRVKEPMLELVATIGGTFEMSLTFGKPDDVGPPKRLEVSTRLREIQLAMQQNAAITKKFTAAQVGNFTTLADVHDIFSNNAIH